MYYNKITHENKRGNTERNTFRTKGSHAQPTQQPKAMSSIKSQFKGVTWSSRAQRWQVQLYLPGQKIHVGSFKKEDERKAAIAYDIEAIKYGLPTNILKPVLKHVA